ncbi:serine hydrolase [Pseudonocardia benzenivorans]|uniref:Serine hydrolase n=1 Tax=Pseudonocardia benzenivorans TaxID=228005 RepID=A0ABW3VFY2_9PSEU
MPEFGYPPASTPAVAMVGGKGLVQYDLSESEWNAAFDRMRGSNWMLVDLAVAAAGSATRYAARWERLTSPRPRSTRWTIPWADYPRVYETDLAAGFRPVVVRPYNVGTELWVAAIWEKAAHRGHHWKRGVPVADLAAHVATVRAGGGRIVDLAAYTRYDAESDTWTSYVSSIWMDAPDGHEWQVTGPEGGSASQATFERLTAEGWAPVQATAYNHADGSTRRFLTRWERDADRTFVARRSLDTGGFGAELAADADQALRLSTFGGYAAYRDAAASPRFSPVLVRRDPGTVVPGLVAEFARDYDVPAVSLAVARHGLLCHTHGHGDADVSTGAPVTGSTSFRIASVSKPITATAVMRLVDRGELTLQDRPFATGGALADLATSASDARVRDITVAHLLRHLAGGWANDDQDPMFRQPDLDATKLVAWVLENRRLDHAPGAAYAYSNFGYCVLGRVIERVTGTSYQQHVRDGLLAECGVTGLRIAGNTLGQRARDEVVYFDQDGDDPYGMQVSRMDAHGGWRGNVVDLVRFGVRVDSRSMYPQVLDQESITWMTMPSGLAGSHGYAAGWAVEEGNWSHNGSLPGTSSLLTRTDDGFWCAVLANTRHDDPDDPSRGTAAGLSTLMSTIRDSVDVWPRGLLLGPLSPEMPDSP